MIRQFIAPCRYKSLCFLKYASPNWITFGGPQWKVVVIVNALYIHLRIKRANCGLSDLENLGCYACGHGLVHREWIHLNNKHTNMTKWTHTITRYPSFQSQSTKFRSRVCVLFVLRFWKQLHALSHFIETPWFRGPRRFSRLTTSVYGEDDLTEISEFWGGGKRWHECFDMN